MKLKNLEDCITPANGTFKYLLIRVSQPRLGELAKYIVRGYEADKDKTDTFFEGIRTRLGFKQLECECDGGGWVKVKPKELTVRVFGKSRTFGTANHAIAADLISEAKAFYDYAVLYDLKPFKSK